MTPAYSHAHDEFLIENDSSQTLSIQIQPNDDSSIPYDTIELSPGQRRVFKKEAFDLRCVKGKATANLFVQGMTQGNSFEIKYPPENVRLTDSLLSTYGVK
ncbi:MAG: hypothetical protein JSR85_05640 [Proteobacteria bacterium]|nr:hypothetical protein [Pseudomonadota bacterium]